MIVVRLGVVAVIAMAAACSEPSPAPSLGPPPAAVAVRALDPPDHGMLFGFFYADGRYGNDLPAVADYTNAYVVCPECYDTAVDWSSTLRATLATAAVGDKPLVVIAGDPAHWDRLVDVLAPVWTRVRFVEIAHEARIRRTAMEARVHDWHARVASRGLTPKPVAAMQDLCQTWQLLRCALLDGWTSPLLDAIGIEAYPPIPGSGPQPGGLPFPVDYDPAHIAANLTAVLTRAEARIRPDALIYLATMAYDRNGEWTDEASLPAIQRATYDWARTRARVTAVLPFAYNRPGGVRDRPALASELEAIGRAISASTR